MDFPFGKIFTHFECLSIFTKLITKNRRRFLAESLTNIRKTSTPKSI